MEVVAEVVLSTTLELLLEKLASSDSWKYVVGGRVRIELKKWESLLVEVREVLWDAENKQIRNESVRKWLGQLRDLAYDMEDVLDEFGYHDQMMRRNDLMMMGAEADGNIIHGHEGNQVRRFFAPSCCTSTFTTPRNLKMGSKIEDITGRLAQISIEREKYGLDKVAAVTQYSATWQRPLNTSLVNESEVYGRDADKKRIIDMLLRLHKGDDDDDHPTADKHSTINVFSVVSIVAMGGMGKTTLARRVYDDAEATKDFTLKAWACVSDQFDAERVTKSILNSIGVSDHSQLEFNESQEKLREELKGKKFLLVLDDVWTDDPNHWYCLRAPFCSAARGSKIIVTTRDKRVAEVMGSGNKNLLHQLQPLSEEECWSVFKQHSNIDDQSTFASIGKQIVNKCDGLPLAARALGGLLFNQRRQEEWEAVLTSPIWELKESTIIPALRLSYNYLPPHLKRCFAYCALFPKDYEFSIGELIFLWMAEGFFEQSNHQVKELEDLGNDYFLELASKSFFQLSASNTSTFVMHDLIHDLAKFVSKQTCLHLDDQSENDPPLSISNSIRHLSYVPHVYDPYRRFEKFHRQSQLRTFMNKWLEKPRYHYISSKLLEELIPQFKCLRVLSLRNYKITEIPNSFGDQLKHLRYLDLSQTHIQWLPDSIGNLFYLQTLKLSGCEQLSKLPISIKNLMNLRHLDISGENKLEEVPSDIHKLKNLRLLSNFIVGENNGLCNLGGMTNLIGELCISKLEDVVDIQDAGLISQQKLKSLIVKWSDRLDGYLGKESSHHLDVLHSLQPRTTLKQLRIEGYGGWEFPNWVGDASFSQMVDLTIKDCGNCTSLPCLGQLPSLKRLSIKGMSGVKKVGAEFYGANNRSFPSLDYLYFKNMQGWEEWEDCNICLGTYTSFPCLRKLRMRDCPNLTINIINFPTCLPRLMKLYISNCRGISNMEEEIMMRGRVDDHLIMTTNTTSLLKLEIGSIPTLAKLDAGFVRGLRDLTISKCDGLTCLWDDDDDGGDGLGSKNLQNSLDDDQMIRDQYCPGRVLGCNLRSLSIFWCGRLERLPNGWHKTLTCLEDLNVHACPKLESFPEVGFPPKLRSLYLSSCDRLECLPNGMMMSKMRENSDVNGSNNSCVILESLFIIDCPSLISLEGVQQLPTTLKSLDISSCQSLESLPAVVCAGLEDLSVHSCPSLTGFPNNNNITSSSTSPSSTLKELSISSCENLKSLPEGIFMTEHDYGGGGGGAGPVLQVLEIDDCPSLQSFPERGMFPSTLEKLEIGGCGQLESISEEMFLHCSSSSSSSQLILSLSDYPNLKALPDHHGLSGALSEISITSCKNLELRPQQFQHFTRLTSLEIRDCENIKTPLSQWGLTRLPSLKSLTIGGIFPDATSFSILLLPTTLAALQLREFKNLESIASLSLHQLCSLEDLKIRDCPKLWSILPRKKRLPPTLLYLLIQTSPLLEKRYSKEKGKDWSKIAHIPHVDFRDDQ